MQNGSQDARKPDSAAMANQNNTSSLTMNQGTKVYNDDHSLTIGNRGPILLEDFHLIEKLQQFDREKVPERIVHARGMTAKGHFEVTHDISHLTSANFLNGIGKQTPVAVRFSLVTHGRDSPEGLRDVRGFATKFYTSEGNWDLVGNNIPVFFIRDGFKFPDLVHAMRPNPANNIQEAWRFLDFLSHHPESTHMMTWIAGMEGIPVNYRHMEGYGVNTFTLVDDSGKQTYVKFIWLPKEGAKYMTDDEAQQTGEFNMRHSHATHDLYNAIADGNYPVWDLHIQTLDPADEDKLDFDPLDCTKVWPVDKFPLQPVGKLTLNQNVNNFHNESEQIAFSPAITIAGIGLSRDKVLQSRVLSYADAARYRIGTNYQMLPINAPKCPFHNSHENGSMNFMEKTGQVNYWPSSIADTQVQAEKEAQTVNSEHISGSRVKQDIPEEKRNDFKQAGERYRNMSEREAGQMIKTLSNWMSDPKCTLEVRDRWLHIWEQVDGGLAAALRDTLAEKQPAESVKSEEKLGHPEKIGATEA
jgi:catalase